MSKSVIGGSRDLAFLSGLMKAMVANKAFAIKLPGGLEIQLSQYAHAPTFQAQSPQDDRQEPIPSEITGPWQAFRMPQGLKTPSAPSVEPTTDDDRLFASDLPQEEQ